MTSGRARLTARRSPGAAIAGAALIVLLCAACGPTGPGPAASPAATVTPQASGLPAAQAYADAFYAATRSGFTNTAPFYAPDAHQDLTFLVDFEGTGRETIVQGARDFQQFPPRAMGGWDQSDAHAAATRVEPVFVDREELLDVRYIPTCGYTVVDRITPTDRGITQESMAGSVERAELFSSGWQALAGSLADRYIAAWSSGDVNAVGSLYAAGATLDDTLLGVQARGRSSIGGLARAKVPGGGLADPRLQASGPAVYVNGGFVVNGPINSGIDGLVLLLDIGNKSCGDTVAVALEFDRDGIITGERRFHRIDRLGSCGAPPTPSRGWWQSVTVPTAQWVGRTGTLGVEAGAPHEIAVWNGDPGITPLISWARQRFADAGMPPPTPSSVTFLPDVTGDRWATYGFLTGSDAPDIGVPVTAAEACPGVPCVWTTTARAAMLHELAHVWLAGNPSYGLGRPSFRASRPRNNRFLAEHGLTWHDPAAQWAQQGGERAAETIAWGLMDQPHTVDARLGPLTCAELAQDFQTLTYSTPDPRACAEPGTTGTGTP